MITINSYQVTEKCVYQGVGAGVEKLLKDVSSFNNPEVVVETIANAVMAELCAVMDFSQAPVKFTGDMLRKIWEASQDENPPVSP